MAHNICVLIMAQCELGIDAVFWDDGKPAAEDLYVLPMVLPPVA